MLKSKIFSFPKCLQFLLWTEHFYYHAEPKRNQKYQHYTTLNILLCVVFWLFLNFYANFLLALVFIRAGGIHTITYALLRVNLNVYSTKQTKKKSLCMYLYNVRIILVHDNVILRLSLHTCNVRFSSIPTGKCSITLSFFHL